MSKNYFGYMIEELKTIKLELDGGKEIYVMYEKPEVNKYVVSIYAKSKDEGNMIHQFGLELPQQACTDIRTNSDRDFEEDIIELVLNNVANNNIVWEDNLEELT